MFLLETAIKLNLLHGNDAQQENGNVSSFAESIFEYPLERGKPEECFQHSWPKWIIWIVNPLSPRSDQYLNSPFNFNTLLSRQVMRIKKIIN